MSTKVPPALWLVESYLNSVDVSSRQDDLDSVPRFRRWLRDHDRPEAAASASDADLELAREVRFELRDIVLGHGDGSPTGSVRLDTVAARVPLRMRFPAGGAVQVVPASDGVPGVLGEVLASIAVAATDGTWRRVKLCRADDCQVVFYDRSKNGSRCWCSMNVCGNRSKTRAYRRRRGAAGG